MTPADLQAKALTQAQGDLQTAFDLLARELSAQIERNVCGFYRNINQAVKAPKAPPKSIE